MSTLVVAAYEPELEGLSPGLRTRAIGIGLVEAAWGAERALAELCPARVVLIGTAGALPGSGLSVGQVALVRAAHLAIRPGEYAPEPMPRESPAHPRLTQQLQQRLDAPVVDAVCSLGITQNDLEARRLAQLAKLEHLECFALFRVAQQAGIPAAAVLAVANAVGSDAADEWRRNHAAAEQAARRAVQRALQAI